LPVGNDTGGGDRGKRSVKSNPEGVHGFLPKTLKIISSVDPTGMGPAVISEIDVQVGTIT
jgi:hypothetical protein